MLVVNRYRVETGDAAGFLVQAELALAALAGRPGFLDGDVGRSTDDPRMWVMVTRWASVGAYRRALSSHEVKLQAVPLMYRAVDEPGAYEVLLEHAADGLRAHASDLAADTLTGPHEPPPSA